MSHQIARSGTSTLDIDDLKAASKSLPSYVYSKLGTCMPPTSDYGTTLAVSRYVAAYGLKGGNLRVVLTKGSATSMLNGHSNTIIDVAVAPETIPTGQSTFATLSAEGMCRVWEISNQDAGSEIDARDTLNLKVKPGGSAQRVFIHPGWIYGGGKNNILFICHDGTVSGVPYSREVREDNAVDPLNGLLIDKYATIKLQRNSKVLDMAFQQFTNAFAWKCATAHEDGTACVWMLTQGGKSEAADDDQSTVSLDSSSVASGPAARKQSKTKEPSLIDIAPHLVIKVCSGPVTSIGFPAPSVLFCGSNRNCELSLWSAEAAKASTSPIQRLALTRTSSPAKSFRASFVKRSVDGAACLVLADSRANDILFISFPQDKKGLLWLMGSVMHYKISHPVLSLQCEYDIEKDKLICHVVDTDCIHDMEASADIVFGSVAPQDVRSSMRRASKRAESMVVNIDTGPVEWSDKPACCTIS